ncbi:MAG: hypothetical protein ACTSRK_06670 [Promethearchaeota archaeon]
MAENSTYIGITFLLYMGSGLILGLILTFADSIFYSANYVIFGLIFAFFGWILFFLFKILPILDGKDGMSFCFLFLFSIVFLIPAMIISCIVLTNIFPGDRSKIRPSPTTKPQVAKINPTELENSLVSQITSTFEVQNLSTTELEKIRSTFELEVSSVSMEEIYVKFSQLQQKFTNKFEVINQLTKWIDEVTTSRGETIPYPKIFQQVRKFVSLNTN